MHCASAALREPHSVTRFRISLADGAHYEADAAENLLAAAQRAQWLVRYGCRNGNCEACAAQLLSGRVECADGRTISAPAAKILLCLCRPRSDLQIVLPSDPRPGSVEQSLRSYAHLQRQCSDANSSVLHFLLPAGRKPMLLAGQLALIETDAGLLQAHIDEMHSSGRELILELPCASPLREGGYYHVRYPLTADSSQEVPDE